MLFYKNNTAHFLWVYWCDNPLGKLGEHSESLYITPSQCRSLPEAQCRAQGGSVQSSGRLSAEPPCITSLRLMIYKLKPIESVFCCLNTQEACWKRYPFSAEPPCIGHYRAYPPLGLIITPAETLHTMGIWDNLEGRNPPRRVGEEVIKSQF